MFFIYLVGGVWLSYEYYISTVESYQILREEIDDSKYENNLSAVAHRAK